MKLIKIGSSLENDVVVNHPSVSPFHAELFKDGQDNAFLTDCASTYGTFVNGKRISQPRVLEAGDRVNVGERQAVDWEFILFNRSTTPTPEPKTESPKPKPETSTTQASSVQNEDLPFYIKHKDLIIIYGLIVFFLILFSFYI